MVYKYSALANIAERGKDGSYTSISNEVQNHNVGIVPFYQITNREMDFITARQNSEK